MNLLHAIHEPKGDGPHPTILALHGWGANALDLLALAPHLAGGRFLVLCPQGPVTVPVPPGVDGFGWFPLTAGSRPDPAAFERAVEALRVFIDAAVPRYPVARDKFALLGFSQGGMMANALALHLRPRLAALASLSSWFPAALAESLGNPSLDHLPALIQHGTRDPLIDVALARESVELLRRLQASVVYREYDMAHEISGPSLLDLSRFLEEKVLSPIVRV